MTSSQHCHWPFEIYRVSRQLVPKRVTRLHNDTRKRERVVYLRYTFFIIIHVGELSWHLVTLCSKSKRLVQFLRFDLAAESLFVRCLLEWKHFDGRESKVETELSWTILRSARFPTRQARRTEFQDSKRKRDETVEIIMRQEMRGILRTNEIVQTSTNRYESI